MSPRPLTAVAAVLSIAIVTAPATALTDEGLSPQLTFDIPAETYLVRVEADLEWGANVPTAPPADLLLAQGLTPEPQYPTELSYPEVVAPPPLPALMSSPVALEIPTPMRAVLSTKNAAGLRPTAALFTAAEIETYETSAARYSYSSLKSEAARLIRNPPRSLRGASELACLAVAIYHEARSESTHGQLAVASVVQQRARVPGRWGNNACDVVRPVQFSFMTSRYNFPRIREQAAWRTSVNLAVKSLIDGPLPELKAADHYHTTGVHPGWRHAMIKIGRIGRHIFYRDPDSPRA